MTPRPFAEQNLVYRGPSADVGDLPCQRVEPGVILSVWEPTPEERLAIAEGADVQLVVLGEPIPPIALAVYAGAKEIPGRPNSNTGGLT